MLPLIWGVVLGLSTGSFANVFLYRYPRGESLWHPGSRCPRCGKPVRWRDNIPVLGWLLLRGRCRDCGKAIPVSYPLVEAAFGTLALAVLLRFGVEPHVWPYLAFFLALLLAALADWQTQYLYDVITLPLGALGLLMSLFFPELLGGTWASALAVAGMLATMLGLQGLGRWLAGRDALGGGDVKLMAAAAGYLGWPHAWLALLLGSLAGLPLLLLHRRVNGGDWKDPVPFGPALCLGCALAAWDRLAGGTELIQWLGFGPL